MSNPDSIDLNKCPACGTTLTGRHCLAEACEFTLRKRLGEIKPHRKLEPESGEALIALISAHGIVLPQNAIQWRVRLAKGVIASLSHSVNLLCTDGVVAWFTLEDGQTLFFGHLAAFEEDKAEREAKPRKPSAKALALAAALLED